MLISLGASAQQPMTLDDCMKYAVDNSLKVRAVQEQNNQATGSKRDAYFNLLAPTLNGYASAGFLSGKNPDPATNMYTDINMFQDTYSLSGKLPLFRGFKAINDVKISKIALESGRSTEQLRSDETCLQTMQSFYNVAYYQQLSKAIEDQVKDAEKSLEKSRKELELGTKNRYQVLESESQLSELQYKLACTQAQLNSAMLLLKETMNFPLDGTLEIDTTTTSSLAEIVAASPQEIASYAKENTPEAIVSRQTMEISKLNLKTARWQCLPSLELRAEWYSMHSMQVGHYDMAQPFKDQIKYNAQKYIGVNMSIPIFNGLQYFSKSSKQKSEYKIASYEFQEKQHEIESAVYKAADEAESALQAAINARKTQELQKEYLDITQKKFQQGLVSYIEYNTINNKYLQSLAEYLNALYTLKIKRAIVGYYNGRSYYQNQ